MAIAGRESDGKRAGTGQELFIVDNSEVEWKVLRYLREWCRISRSMDIATGYFEVGSLLSLDSHWQQVDNYRILLGEDTSARTQNAFNEALKRIRATVNGSAEEEKERNDFLEGLPAIIDALQSRKIHCKVYRRAKFHAKAYITHSRFEVMGSAALVGSSNFTLPGLTENIELNVQITGRQVAALQDWFEVHWEDAEDITEEIVEILKRHVEDYTPFDVYMKSLQEYFRGHQQSEIEWERNHSKIYPILDTYQKDGYHNLLKNADRWGGSFLCDAVGLGKTFIGLMLIERLAVLERKRIALFAPKSAMQSVWEPEIKRHLKHLSSAFGNSLVRFNHTDLLRDNEEIKEKLKDIEEMADVIVIDEAHHFRNMGLRGEPGEPRKSRYWRLYDIARGKKIYMLTATPVNNRITDLMHMIQLFSGHDDKGTPRVNARHFQDIGIHSLPGHFRRLEKALDRLVEQRRGGHAEDELELDLNEAEEILSRDTLYRAIVVQRSRAYVKRSLALESNGRRVIFPVRQDPQVVDYSIRKTYGKLLKLFEEAFNKEKPLFALSTYYPEAFRKREDDSDPFVKGRQGQVVAMIRTLFLKLFESSPRAFEFACWNLMKKLLAWMKVNATSRAEKHALESWLVRHNDLIHDLERRKGYLLGNGEEDAEEDFLPAELLEQVDDLDRRRFEVAEMVVDTTNDLDTLAGFLTELRRVKAKDDDKLRALIKLMKSDPVLKTQKVLIFTEFMTTARYIAAELEKAGIEGVEEIDSKRFSSNNRKDLIERFAPYYNDLSSAKLEEQDRPEIRVLVSTDVLSEGLNLQDATRLINYDLHWNPVRLMQRIGRVDRRMNEFIEARLVADHPNQKEVRGTVAYWNFLPPDELDELLFLYGKVAKKTLRISKTFGIEGGKLLKPEDDYEDLRLFNEKYEQQVSPEEAMKLRLERALKDDPALATRLDGLPGRVFSGRRHAENSPKGVFFCYALPVKTVETTDDGTEVTIWSAQQGPVAWYYLNLITDEIVDLPLTIDPWIRSKPDTPRKVVMEPKDLRAARLRVEQHIKHDYMRRLQVGQGARPILKTWMEVN